MKIRVLGRETVKQILDMPQVIQGVKEVYILKALGQTVVWPLVSHDFQECRAVMDIRSGYIVGKKLHGLKMLNNFPNNLQRGLPGFNGILMVFDSDTGIPLGVLDAAHITSMRTGAAGALGAVTLARKDSKHAFILGAGKQAPFLIGALLTLMPQIQKVYIADPLSTENAKNFAKNIPDALKHDLNVNCDNTVFEAVDDMAECVGDSDIIMTATPSRKAVILKEWVKPGTHFSCIGADMEGKEEIDPLLFKGARIFADDKAQCLRVGEMELPVANGVISESDVAGEIGQVLAGSVSGRQNDEEITIFDATGLALLDLITGKFAIDKANEMNLGTEADM